MKKVNRTTYYIVFSALVLTLVVFVVVYIGVSGRLKTKKELLNYKNASASLVLSEDGILLGKFYFENRTNIPFNLIPKSLIDALIATEDIRFFEHKGNDAKSFFRVLVKSILMNKRSSGGGSTITQQLAKNMFGRINKGLFPVFKSKISEVIMARRLEKVFSKEEILTLYLNTVSFGENLYGVEAASARFFNKSTSLLKIEESAVLIGMLKANTFFNPRLHPENAKSRRNVVIDQMEKYKYLDTKVADSLSGLPLVIDYKRSLSAGIAEYFLVQARNETDEILKNLGPGEGRKWDLERDGLVITTTINFSLQNYAVASFREHLSGMQKRLYEQYQSSSGKKILDQVAVSEMKRLDLEGRADEKRIQELFDWSGTYTDSITVADSLKKSLTILHAGLMAMDPAGGGVKAWVGGIDFKTQPYDQVMARRQLASVFKPVIYSAALEDGYEPCQYLDNDSVTLSGFEDWSPENFDHSFGGKYSLSGALTHSMNIPTFSLYLEIGFDRVNSMWNDMGFSFTLQNTPSLSMGTAEASIKEVATAYSSIANGGYRIKPWCIRSIKTPEGEIIYSNETTPEKVSIMSERSSQLMSAMLQKAIREGTGVSMGNIYGVDFPLAGKTGTSQDYADAWFAAFNPKLVIVARAGASSRAIHFNNGSYGSGSALALPLVALTLKKVKQDPLLKEKLITCFPDLSPELADALDCPDFKEKNLFDRIIDIFEKDKKDYEGNGRKVERTVKSIFKKLFKKRD
ncbi:MAG TPA: penicillin-binding protein [Bacteroidales bacterium]|nr:penicillin-binding protein [Bacteroidales bacterium]